MSSVAEPKAPSTNPGLSSWMSGLPPLETKAIAPGELPKNPDDALMPGEAPPATAAPAKPAEPPATPPAAPDPAKTAEPAKPDEDDESKWPRSAKDWDAFKAKRKQKEAALAKERDEIKADRDRVLAEIEQLKKSGPSPGLETLKKERDEYEKQLRIVSVENHPKFKAYFDGKMESQVKLAKAIVGADNADVTAKILALPEGELRDAKLAELVETLPPFQQARLGSVINAISEINSERQAEIIKARENYDTLLKEQNTSREAMEKKNRADAESAVGAVLSSLTDPKSGNFLFQKKEGNEAWNKEVDDRIASFKHLTLGPATREQRLQACRDAVALPAALKWGQEQAAEVVKLQEQVKALSAATPKPGGGSEPRETGAAPATAIPKIGARPMDVTQGWIKGLQGEWSR